MDYGRSQPKGLAAAAKAKEIAAALERQIAEAEADAVQALEIPAWRAMLRQAARFSRGRKA